VVRVDHSAEVTAADEVKRGEARDERMFSLGPLSEMHETVASGTGSL